MASNYHDAITKRLGIIQGMGTDALQRTMPRAPQGVASGYTGGGGSSPVRGGAGGGSDFDRFINSIIAQESGGNYGAVNRHSGALGRYQIMPSNISSWSRGALGQSITPQQFLSNPQYQDQIAKWQLQNYYNQFGPAGAAVAWYAGPGNAQKYVKNPNGWNKKQGNYPSIAQYVAQVLARM